MKLSARNSASPPITKIHKLFSRDLALENDYLRQENRILRNKLGARVPLTEADRRILVRYGLRLKDRLAEVICIVKPETLLAWNRRQKQKKWTFDNQPGGPGRPRKNADTQALIMRLAEENGSWGYKRIAGELRKLGHQASPSHVRDVLRRQGLPPVPNRKGLSWKQFLDSHLEVTWATDFFTEEVWTLSGLVTFYVLFFIHLGSRRVWMAGRTPQPCAAWMAQQARNFSMVVEDWKLPSRYLVHDRGTSFAAMDGVLKTRELRILKTPVVGKNSTRRQARPEGARRLSASWQAGIAFPSRALKKLCSCQRGRAGSRYRLNSLLNVEAGRAVMSGRQAFVVMMKSAYFRERHYLAFLRTLHPPGLRSILVQSRPGLGLAATVAFGAILADG